MLIDLEFACVSNGIPFTQEGEPMSCCSLYVNVCAKMHAFQKQRAQNVLAIIRVQYGRAGERTSGEQLHDAVRSWAVPKHRICVFKMLYFVCVLITCYTCFDCWMPQSSQHVQARQIAMTAGHTRKVRPGLYEQPRSSTCDLILVGDLMEACHVPDLGDQGGELVDAMQAGRCNTAESVLEHAWFI